MHSVSENLNFVICNLYCGMTTTTHAIPFIWCSYQ